MMSFLLFVRHLRQQALLTLVFTACSLSAFAWSEHPLITHPILETMPLFRQLDPVEAKSLEVFLIEEQYGLAKVLQAQEEWARRHLPEHAPRPDALAFEAGGDPSDIRARFLSAIRINPHAKIPLYLFLLPGQDPGGREPLPPSEITPLSRHDDMWLTRYAGVKPGEMLRPQDVLATATNEPDYGLDLGLFADNHTDWGQEYGFGTQPFGNPNLDYGTQAPFHMGFYHEGRIIFAAAPFLKRTHVEYRIHLYKTLSQYAFMAGQDYWGWRFMGWALHYLQDLSMPYHASVLPRVSRSGMLWINLKAMLGFPGARDRAIQLVSNCHAAMERFQLEVMRQAHQDTDPGHPLLTALKQPTDPIPYSDDFPREVVARESAGMDRRTDRRLRRYLPDELVNNPRVEVVGSTALAQVVELTLEEKGQAGVDGMYGLLAERFRALSMHSRSFIEYVLASVPPSPDTNP